MQRMQRMRKRRTTGGGRCVGGGFTLLVAGLCLSSVLATSARAEDAPGEAPALPAITLDRDAGHVEIEAEVVNRDAEWLELLVCSPNTREYESILASPARPSHIHLALLLLEIEPGAPLSWRQAEDAEDADDAAEGAGARFVVQPPTGPEISIYCIWQDEEGQRHEVPANDWVRNQLTDEPLERNQWVFAGSVFHRLDEAMPAAIGERAEEDDPGDGDAPQRVYMADLNGTVISLVNFGDDLLTRPTTTTNRNDEQAWAAQPDRIPAEGTAVTVRLVPTGERIDPDDPPADRELAPDSPFVPPSGELPAGAAETGAPAAEED